MSTSSPLKLFIATPLYGPPESAQVSAAFHSAFMRLMTSTLPGLAGIVTAKFVNADLVRARSRAVREFLATDCTHLLFWDDDVDPEDPRVVWDMMQSGHDCVGLAYPHKSIHWHQIAAAVRDESEQSVLGRQTGREVEQFAATFPIRTGDGPVEVKDGYAQIEAIGFGFLLLTRACCERMVAAYGQPHPDGLLFSDTYGGASHPTVALFQLAFARGELLHEDHSFCHRWRALGGAVHVCVSPAAHVGRHAYKGSVLSLGSPHDESATAPTE